MGGKHHGHSKTDEYRIWKAIKTRCTNPNSIGWRNYGGRGITMHPLLASNFLNFLAEVGARPSPLHSIERKDNSRGYEPGNILWATKEEQNNNKRTNHLLTANGKTATLTQWAAETGLTQSAIRQRLKRGASPAEAVNPNPTERKPPPQSVLLTHDGQTKPVKAWAREKGLSPGTIRNRIKWGWPAERLLDPPTPKAQAPRRETGQFDLVR